MLDEYEQQIQFYVDSNGKCPVCYTECKINRKSDSFFWDTHFCPKCGWLVGQMSMLGKKKSEGIEVVEEDIGKIGGIRTVRGYDYDY